MGRGGSDQQGAMSAHSLLYGRGANAPARQPTPPAARPAPGRLALVLADGQAFSELLGCTVWAVTERDMDSFMEAIDARGVRHMDTECWEYGTQVGAFSETETGFIEWLPQANSYRLQHEFLAILNDGQTYSHLDGCRVVELSPDSDDLDGATVRAEI